MAQGSAGWSVARLPVCQSRRMSNTAETDIAASDVPKVGKTPQRHGAHREDLETLRVLRGSVVKIHLQCPPPSFLGRPMQGHF